MTDVEAIEREAAELEARLAKAQERVRAKRVKKAAETRAQKANTPGPLEKIQRGNATQTLSNSHGGYAGRTLIQRIESQMDKCHRRADKSPIPDQWWWRMEGMAAALAILRSSSMDHEIQRSGERLDGAA